MSAVVLSEFGSELQALLNRSNEVGEAFDQAAAAEQWDTCDRLLVELRALTRQRLVLLETVSGDPRDLLLVLR